MQRKLMNFFNFHFQSINFIQFFQFSLALIPFIVGLSFGCMGFFFILGFLANAAIAALYGKIVLGRK